MHLRELSIDSNLLLDLIRKSLVTLNEEEYGDSINWPAWLLDCEAFVVGAKCANDGSRITVSFVTPSTPTSCHTPRASIHHDAQLGLSLNVKDL